MEIPHTMNRVQLYQAALRALLDTPRDERWCVGLCHAITEAIGLDKYKMNYELLQNREIDKFYKIWHRVNDAVWGRNNDMPEISKYSPGVERRNSY